ncbi:MAG: autotransporter assembly complex protein TamA [Sulfuriferula sp.]|nr:autotransporter assembly complex protein TamA [Sulfuriferula sp.]
MRINPTIAQLALTGWLLLILGFGAAPAAALDYSIELDAPNAIRPLLTQNLDIYRWRDKPALDDAQLRRLYRLTPDSIAALLETEGYYSPSIVPSIEQQNGIWHLHFKVDPGEPVHVANITLSAQGALATDPAQYRAWLNEQYQLWPLKNGTVFRQAAWETAKRDLLTSLIIAKYPKARLLDSTAVVNPASHSVVINIVIDSGAVYHFSTTTITGLHRYPASIVERLNPIIPGEPYSQAKLLAFQSQLQGSTYFKTVNITTEADDVDPTALRVKVNLVEMQRQKLGFGLGISTDSGPRGQIEYQNLNSLDSNLRFTGTLKLDAQSSALSGQIARPRDEQGYVDSISATTNRTDIEGQITSQSATAIKRTRTRDRIETSLIAQYQVEHQTVAGSTGDNLQALTLNYIWTYRNVDNLIAPTRGYLFSTEIGGAAKSLLSDQSFVRSRSRAIYFYPVTERDSLTLRGELGIVFAPSTSGIPTDMLFRTGGDTTIRGYAYQSLGVQQGDAIVGGRYLINGSVEYTRWLTPKWGAALFYDRGNAVDTLQNFHTVAGYGAGVRWRSPIGPLNLDIAYGEAVSAFRIHFSLGSAF